MKIWVWNIRNKIENFFNMILDKILTFKWNYVLWFLICKMLNMVSGSSNLSFWYFVLHNIKFSLELYGE
jgi:hypothetical protein